MRLHHNYIFWLTLAVFLWLLTIPLACSIGPGSHSQNEVFRVLLNMLGFNHDNIEPQILTIIGNIRCGRVMLSLLCGGGLAVAGVTLQGVLRNPLADPFTLGISAGAACGASIFIGGLVGTQTVFFCLMHDNAGISLAAFLGAMTALALVLALGRGKGMYGKETVVLSGIAVATFLGAIVALIKALNEESVTSIVFWIMGSFQGRGFDEITYAAMPILLGGLCIVFNWRELDILALGDKQAMHLGVNLTTTRFFLLTGASCMTAGCVAVSGVIGFVGLVAPHILRCFIGEKHGPLLFGAWFCGGLLLCWSDVIARSVLGAGQELPVGVVTALLGGPFFAFLVFRSDSKP